MLRDDLAIDRTLLANERTLLAYLRTALALVIAGLTIVHFADAVWYQIAGWCCVPLAMRFRKVNARIREEAVRREDISER